MQGCPSQSRKRITVFTTSPEVERKLHLIEELDLEPIAFKLVHPEPGEVGMSVETADQLIVKYRNFLKLCVMYPEQSIVPSKEVDPVWHTHILDTAKYLQDCDDIFGFVLHHFPYLGLRGDEDIASWHQSFEETCALYEQHFGDSLVSSAAACGDTGDSGGMCDGGACDSSSCSPPFMLNRERPRLVRA
jgi:hypothetical protein